MVLAAQGMIAASAAYGMFFVLATVGLSPLKTFSKMCCLPISLLLFLSLSLSICRDSFCGGCRSRSKFFSLVFKDVANDGVEFYVPP
jgi:hypothetical protein